MCFPGFLDERFHELWKQFLYKHNKFAINVFATTRINLYVFFLYSLVHDSYKRKMAPLVLYSDYLSPPCRGVLLAVAAAGIKLDIETMSLLAGDTKKEEFLKVCYNKSNGL